MQIDQPRHHGAAGAVDHLAPALQAGRHRGDPAVADAHVEPPAPPAARVDHLAAAQQEVEGHEGRDGSSDRSARG